MKEVIMVNKILDFFMDARADDEEIPAWKRLDIVTRKWAIMSAHEKDQSDYQKRKEMYE
jgi:hypothetical protein